MLAVLLPGLLAVQWFDQRHTNDTREHVTTVRRGVTVTFGHAQWRLLGRVATAEKSDTPGALPIKLLIQVRPLDAQGVKQAEPMNFTFRLRDRAGHIWNASGDLASEVKPVVGQPSEMNITADIPARLVGSVVLEMQQSPLVQPPSRQWYRFAH